MTNPRVLSRVSAQRFLPETEGTTPKASTQLLEFYSSPITEIDSSETAIFDSPLVDAVVHTQDRTRVGRRPHLGVLGGHLTRRLMGLILSVHPLHDRDLDVLLDLLQEKGCRAPAENVFAFLAYDFLSSRSCLSKWYRILHKRDSQPTSAETSRVDEALVRSGIERPAAREGLAGKLERADTEHSSFCPPSQPPDYLHVTVFAGTKRFPS